ncbi:TPA: hypothetical protein ACHU7L_001343 [Streptococcus suis]
MIDGNYYWNKEEINNLENILGLRQLGLSVKAIIRIKELHDTKCCSLEQLKENKQVILMKLPTVKNKSSCSKNRRKIYRTYLNKSRKNYRIYNKIPAITRQRGLLILQTLQHILNMLDGFFTSEQVNSVWQLWSVHFA